MIAEFYSQKDNCLKEIRKARELFGNRSTTEKQYTGMESALSYMYLYCPDEIRNSVESTLQEAEMRKPMFIRLWRKSELPKVQP